MKTGNFYNCSKDYGNMTAAEIKKYNRRINKLLSVSKKRKYSKKKQSKRKKRKRKRKRKERKGKKRKEIQKKRT